MTQAIKIATITPKRDDDESELVQRMGLAVVRHWGALSTEVKALLRDQAIAVDLGGGRRIGLEDRVDTLLQHHSGK
jgi:hypothetical protein